MVKSQAAGIYTDRVQLLARSKTTNNIGEAEETFVPGGYLWCRISEDSSRRATEYGGQQTGIEGTIAIRNFPTVTSLDLLRDSLNRVWKIEGIRRGDDELICDVYTDDSLQDWTEAE